jgi:hypothetical protein
MSVRREAGRVWIEGVPALAEPGLKVPWLARTSQTCTFAGALEAALSLTERPYSYEEIMALSGMAFRTRWLDGENGPTGCPCAPVGETPDVKRRLPAAIGWQIDEYSADGWDKPIMQKAKTAAVRSIDAGRPVTVIDRHLNSVVAYGYAEDGEVLLLQTLEDGAYECPLSGLGQSPSLAHVLQGPEEPPPFPQVFGDVVGDAVERWYRVKAEFIPDRLKNGQAALQAWMRGLELHEELATKVDPGRLLFNHLWAYKHLWDARRAAANFLGQHAAIYAAAQEPLLRAADLYRQEADLLGRAYDDPGTYIGSFEDLGMCIGSSGHEDTDATQWTPDMRRRERQILAQCLDFERAAVEAMREALPKMAPSDNPEGAPSGL